MLDQLSVQLENMSQEEYDEQLALIEEMNEGPTADEIIRTIHQSNAIYITAPVFDYFNFDNILSHKAEYAPSKKDCSLAA